MVGRILEAYIDCVPTASNLFHDLGGLKKATERLLREIEEGSKPIQLGGTILEMQPNSPHGTLPYQRRNLIKFLMRDVAVSCYTQQVTVRPDVSPLPDDTHRSYPLSPNQVSPLHPSSIIGA